MQSTETKEVFRYESASEIRKVINSKLDTELRNVLKFTVQRVYFTDLARDSMFFVTLKWPRQGEVPVLAPEFKARGGIPRGNGRCRMKMWTFNYRPELDARITNLAALPRGTGCTVLECIVAPDNFTLVAKQWRRGEPYAYDAIIRFPGNRFYKTS